MFIKTCITTRKLKLPLTYLLYHLFEKGKRSILQLGTIGLEIERTRGSGVARREAKVQVILALTSELSTPLDSSSSWLSHSLSANSRVIPHALDKDGRKDEASWNLQERPLSDLDLEFSSRIASLPMASALLDPNSLEREAEQ